MICRPPQSVTSCLPVPRTLWGARYQVGTRFLQGNGSLDFGDFNVTILRLIAVDRGRRHNNRQQRNGSMSHQRQKERVLL
jgi:hypothetical protein